MISLLQDFFLFIYSFESLESFSSLKWKKITTTIQKKNNNKTKQQKKTKYSSKNKKITTRVKKQQWAQMVSLSNLIYVTFSLYRLF